MIANIARHAMEILSFFSLRIPSLKKVVLSRMRSCWRFSSAVASSNLLKSICMLSGDFFGSSFLISIFSPLYSKSMRLSRILYITSLINVIKIMISERNMVVPIIMG